MNGFKGSGKLSFALFDDNNNLIPKYYPLGNATTLELTPESETTEVLSTENDDYGQALDSMTDPKPTKGTVTINRFNRRNLALAFMGEDSQKAIGETTITDEVIACVKGGAHRLANGNVSAVVIQDETDTTTYEVGTDYTVETGPGFTLIQFPETSNIPDEAVLHADYTAGADDGYVIDGGVKSTRKIRLLCDGRNRYTGAKGLLEVFEASLSPSSSFNFLAAENAEASFGLTAISVDVGGTKKPFQFHVNE